MVDYISLTSYLVIEVI